MNYAEQRLQHVADAAEWMYSCFVLENAFVHSGVGGETPQANAVFRLKWPLLILRRIFVAAIGIASGHVVRWPVPRSNIMLPSVPTLSLVSAPTADLTRSDFGHAVRFYSDETSFFYQLTDFVCAVLRSQEPVIMVATGEHCRMIRQMLTARGCDPDRRPLVLLDAEATLERFMVGNEPDAMRFRDVMLRNLARARGGFGRNEQRVTIFGEMVAVLWTQGNPIAALQLEEMWNDLSGTQRFSLICGYPAHLFEGSEHWDAFSNVCATHSAVLPHESYAALRSEDEALPTIAGLQVKARSLEKEMVRRKEIETDLSSRIEERTAEVEQARSQLQDLSARLVRLRDQESKRIAQELHDSTAQLLSVLAMYVDLLEGTKESFSPAAAQLISRSNALVRQILLEVRSLSYGLYPPTLHVIGLSSALEWYCTRFRESTGTPLKVETPECMERLAHPVEMAMFRLVQECLAKVHQLVPGSHVTVRVSRSPEGATLSVTVDTSSASAAVADANALEIFRSTPNDIQERVRQLNGRVFTVCDASHSGVSIFFPCPPSGVPAGHPVPSAS
jgi:signal transduction histidine kinase